MGQKKFPRNEVLEKQLAVVAAEDPESISAEDLEKIQGGNLASVLSHGMICYGVGAPPFLRNLTGGGSGGNGGKA